MTEEFEGAAPTDTAKAESEPAFPEYERAKQRAAAIIEVPRCSEWTRHEKHIFVELQCLLHEHEDGEERVKGIIRYAEYIIRRKREKAA